MIKLRLLITGLVMAMSMAGMAIPAAAATEQPETPLPAAGEKPSPPPALEAKVLWKSLSSAYLSPTAAAKSKATNSNVTNAANAKGLIRIGLSKPVADTWLEIFPNKELLGDGDKQLMAINDPVPLKVTTAETLKQVCVDGSILNKPSTVTPYSIRCRLDPAKWGATDSPAGSTDSADPQVAIANASAVENQKAVASSNTGQRFVLLAIGGYDSIAGTSNNGQTRAQNLDLWLKRRAGSSLTAAAAEALSITLAKAVKLTKGGQEIASADLGWDQCFAAASGERLRSTCRPNSAYDAVFSQAGISADAKATLPQDTTSDFAYGSLVPGKRWKGELSLTNQSQLRGWPGPSPYGPAVEAKDFAGYQTEYVITDLAPKYASNGSITVPAQDAFSSSYCRQNDDTVRNYFPDEIRKAQSVCALKQTGSYLQPYLFNGASNGSEPLWAPKSGAVGQVGLNVNYNVPLDFLEKAANDPDNWELVEQDVEQLKYVDDEGGPLRIPIKETVKLGNYVSKTKPAVWAWMPKECSLPGSNIGIPTGSVVCAADAKLDAAKASDQAPADLELVKVAEANDFVRSICALCWPAPETLSAAWTSPNVLLAGADSEAVKAARAHGMANSTVMAGQFGYLAVNAVNESQTSGFWSRLKIVINGVPDGVTIAPDRAMKAGDDGAPVWPREGVDKIAGLNESAFKCEVGATGADGKKTWTCAITASAAAELRDNKADLSKLGLPDNFESGTYSFLFRVVVGLDAKPLDGEGAYVLNASVQYPHFKPGINPIGSTAGEATSAELIIIPESEAVAGLTVMKRNPDYDEKDSKTDIWNVYSGKPLEIPIMSAEPAANPNVNLRYQVENQGQRWIRPGDVISATVELPAGVVPGPTGSSYEFGHSVSEELRSYGEQWTCPDPAKKQVQSSPLGFQFTWDVYSLTCSATVSQARASSGGLAAPADGTQASMAGGLRSQFPGLVLPLSGDIPSPTDQDLATASVSVTRDGIAISDADNPNGTARIPIRIIDPSAAAPTIQSYWLVRPVAGGHASARIDIANINRPAASNMNLLLGFSPGSKFKSGSGIGWQCDPINGRSGAACRYSGSLRAHQGTATENPDYDRTAPLLVEADIDPAATGEFHISAQAEVFAIDGAESTPTDGGVSYAIGKPIQPVAGSLSDDAVSLIAQPDSASDPSSPVSFDGPITSPTMRGARIQLDALNSKGPFVGQPSTISWKQVCVLDRPETKTGEDCSAQATEGAVATEFSAPQVSLSDPASFSPTFIAPNIVNTERFRFKLTVSDPLEPTGSIGKPIASIAVNGSQQPVLDPATLVSPNSASSYVDVVISPPTQQPESGRQAGTEEGTGLLVAPPGAVQIAEVVADGTQLSVRIAGPFSDGGSAITGFEYSTDNGATWAVIARANETDPFILTRKSAAGGEPLLNGATYQVKMRARNSSGPGVESDSVEVVLGSVVSPGPSGIAIATPSGSTSPSLTAAEPSPSESPDSAESSPTPTDSPSSSASPSDTPSGATSAPSASASSSTTSSSGSASPSPSYTPVAALSLACTDTLNKVAARGLAITIDGTVSISQNVSDARLCQLENASAKVGSWLTLATATVDISPTNVKIIDGGGELPSEWGYPSGSDIGKGVVGYLIDVPINGDIVGELLGASIPFGDSLDSGLGLENKKFQVAFAGSGTEKIKTTVSITATNGDAKLTISGTVEESGKFSLQATIVNLISIGGVKPSFSGKIDYDPAKPGSGLEWTLGASVTGIVISNSPKVVLNIDTLELTASALRAGASLEIGDASPPTKLSIGGEVSEGVLTLTGSQQRVEWAVLSDMPMDFEEEINYTFPETGGSGDFSVKLTAAGTGTSSYSNGNILLDKTKIVLEGNSTKGVWGAKGSVEGAMKVTGSDPLRPLELLAAGEAKLASSGVALSLTANQPPGSGGFEVAKNVWVNDFSFQVAYDSSKSANSKVIGKLAGEAAVYLPAQAGAEQPKVTGSIATAYDGDGISFQLAANDMKWDIATGITLSDLEIAYQSFVKNYTPKTVGVPVLNNFKGLVVIGAVVPGDGSFLKDTLKFKGPEGSEGKLAAYARIDSDSGTFEAAVLSRGSIPIFGDTSGTGTGLGVGADLAAGKASLKINNPYLKVVYGAPTAPVPVPATPVAKTLTVSLGGVGALRYPDSDGAMKEFSDLSVGASLELGATAKFAGTMKFTQPWVNAGGIAGLNIDDAAIDIGVDGGKVSASFFAKLNTFSQAQADTSPTPSFLQTLGLVPGTSVFVGFAMTDTWCAKLSIGESGDTAKAALKPLSFIGDSMADVLRVNYASFVYVPVGGRCVLGGETLNKTAIALNGDILKTFDVNLQLDATPTEDGDIALSSPAGGAGGAAAGGAGNRVESAALGPATISDAKVRIVLDTAKAKTPETKTKAAESAISLSGSIPIGGKKVEFLGGISPKKTAQSLTNLEFSLAAALAEGQSLDFGKFKINNPKIAVAMNADPYKGVWIDPKTGFKMSLAGAADILGSRFDTDMTVDYAGGNVQRMYGQISAVTGVKVGDNVMVKGSGAIDWNTATGLAVTIGDQRDLSKRASFAYCEEGVDSGASPMTCRNDKKYAFEKAYLDVGPKGFSAIGTLTVGSTFTGELTGSYFTADDEENDLIRFADQELGRARSGDFSFGLDNATINLPSGRTNAAVAVARYTDQSGQKQTVGKLKFSIPMLSGTVGFDGTYNTSGLYNIEGSADALSLGGFTVSGKVNVYNTPDGVNTVPQTVDINVGATLREWGNASFSGKFGYEDGFIGYRMKGAAKARFSTVSADIALSYSNYPIDAGFGFATTIDAGSAGSVGVQVGGVFRTVNDQFLYRAAGGISIPVVAGVKALGTAQLDNCLDRGSLACGIARTDASGNIVPQIKVVAGVEVGGGLATAAVRGDIGFDGAFRLIGSAQAGVSMGPWSFFGVVSAEAGFSLNVGVCLANHLATTRADKMGCGQDLSKTWVVGLDGRAWASATINMGFFKGTARSSARVAGVVYPSISKYCAVFALFGYDITFGTCPAPGEIPAVGDIRINTSEFV